MITSKYAGFETQFNISFTLWKSYVSLLQYWIFYILNYIINFESCDVIMNISTRRIECYYIFWIANHLPKTLDQLTAEAATGGVLSKKGVLNNFAKFIGKHLCQSLFFNKVKGLRPSTLLKKRLWYRWFPVDFAKFLRILFLQNTSDRLLL